MEKSIESTTMRSQYENRGEHLRLMNNWNKMQKSVPETPVKVPIWMDVLTNGLTTGLSIKK